MQKQINIGLLGAGTVGGGVILVLKQNAQAISKRVGAPVKIKKVYARHPEKVTDLDPDLVVTDNVDDLIMDPEIDIIVELIGREQPAKDYMTAALTAGKNVITANKDVIAKYGQELFSIAESQHKDFLFEAAVAGGIPIIRPLKACLAANNITSLMGIINGTTNYMLTKMHADHEDFNKVLQEAQDKGYAESDPTADIGGLDAARKLVILASIAFNTRIALEDVYVEGIEKINVRDIEYAQELGYVIKLLAIAKNNPQTGISVRVHPTMLPINHPLTTVNDVYNAIYVSGDIVGDTMFFGKGAGRMPTASAVCGDIIECSRNIIHGCTGRLGCTCYEKKRLCSIENIYSPSYMRLLVQDKPGVLAAIASAFGSQNVSLKNVIQKKKVDNLAEIVVITYGVSEYNLRMAEATLQGLPVVEKISNVIRVEDNTLE